MPEIIRSTVAAAWRSSSVGSAPLASGPTPADPADRSISLLLMGCSSPGTRATLKLAWGLAAGRDGGRCRRCTHYAHGRRPGSLLPAPDQRAPSHQRVRSCPPRARSSGQTRTLAVAHGTDTLRMTCMVAGPAGSSHGLPSWSCGLAGQSRSGTPPRGSANRRRRPRRRGRTSARRAGRFARRRPTLS
jgi:hypothetical protein